MVQAMNEILVTIGGLLTIAAIVWWFWFSTPKAMLGAINQAIEIRVEGGAYQPAIIEIPAGKPLTLRFIRIDATPCAEKVVFGDLAISADLSLGKPYEIALPALQPGTHEFTCQMGMYRGKLIAK
jgi:plastocyanin domain-containing protein